MYRLNTVLLAVWAQSSTKRVVDGPHDRMAAQERKPQPPSGITRVRISYCWPGRRPKFKIQVQFLRDVYGVCTLVKSKNHSGEPSSAGDGLHFQPWRWVPASPHRVYCRHAAPLALILLLYSFCLTLPSHGSWCWPWCLFLSSPESWTSASHTHIAGVSQGTSWVLLVCMVLGR